MRHKLIAVIAASAAILGWTAASAATRTADAKLGNLHVVVISGKVYKRLTGSALRHAIICTAYMAPPPNNYHGAGLAFGRNGRYLKLNDRYGEVEGRYWFSRDTVVVAFPGRSDRDKFVFFRADDGGTVLGRADEQAKGWARAELVIENACAGERG